MNNSIGQSKTNLTKKVFQNEILYISNRNTDMSDEFENPQYIRIHLNGILLALLKNEMISIFKKCHAHKKWRCK
ncbi:MAG: hypothetical protein PWQ97_1086 [Tepidanaerobacteraceae bacterium]|nr:hypothetical protein [Tepidanaerobacteraceae bacterium]